MAEARDTLLETWRHVGQYRDFGNGRGVRNIYEKVIQNHAERLVNVRNPGTGNLINILGDDFQNREEYGGIAVKFKEMVKAGSWLVPGTG